jgi:hypothetical protein
LTASPSKARRRVFTGSVKDIVLLNERRIALTELTIKLQVRTKPTLASTLHIIDPMLEER